MKIQVSVDDLSKELYKLKGIVTKKSTLSILSQVLLEAEDGTLKLSATDLDTSASTHCECDVLDAGSFSVEAKKLIKLVKGLDEDIIQIKKEDNNWGEIECGSLSCRVPGRHPEDFPEMFDDEIDKFEINSDMFLNMVNKTEFSISEDDARANLTGAFFKLTNADTFLMVSTDGHRLSKTESKVISDADAFPDEFREGVIIPKKSLNEIKRIVGKGNYDLFIGVENKTVVFEFGPLRMAVRTVEGTFPDYTQVLPEESDRKAFVQRSQLMDAINFMSLFANKKTNNIRITLDDDCIDLYASDPENGEGNKIVPSDYNGDTVKAGYNHKYIKDVLSAIDGEEVTVDINDELSPTLIKDPEDESSLFVVMPMRL